MREHGAIIVNGIQTGTTQNCPHCNSHFVVASNGTLAEARRSGLGDLARPRVWCRKCDRLTCGRPGCDPAVACIPSEARLEHVEGKKTRYDDDIDRLKARGAPLL